MPRRHNLGGGIALLVDAVSGHGLEALEEMRPRDANTVEARVSIVHRRRAKLAAHLDDATSRQQRVVFERAEVNQEGVHAVRFAANDEVGHDHAVCGGETAASDPHLSSRRLWSVDDPLVGVVVEGGGGPECREVGAVCELGLHVATEPAARPDHGTPFGPLFGACLSHEGGLCHALCYLDGEVLVGEETEHVCVLLFEAVAVADLKVAEGDLLTLEEAFVARLEDAILLVKSVIRVVLEKREEPACIVTLGARAGEDARHGVDVERACRAFLLDVARLQGLGRGSLGGHLDVPSGRGR